MGVPQPDVLMDGFARLFVELGQALLLFAGFPVLPLFRPNRLCCPQLVPVGLVPWAYAGFVNALPYALKACFAVRALGWPGCHGAAEHG
jgi:hypothetical protein